MKAAHLLTGRHAEQTACQWLQQHGLRLLHSNYRCRCGEIDLVMLHADCLVFVEVRYRASAGYGGPLDSVTRAKQAKLLLTAKHFLQHHKAHRIRPVRFDVIALTGRAEQRTIDWRQRAFIADSG